MNISSIHLLFPKLSRLAIRVYREYRFVGNGCGARSASYKLEEQLRHSQLVESIVAKWQGVEITINPEVFDEGTEEVINLLKQMESCEARGIN